MFSDAEISVEIPRHAGVSSSSKRRMPPPLDLSTLDAAGRAHGGPSTPLEDSRTCWICFSADADASTGPLDSGYCGCKGTVVMHQACLETYIERSGATTCPMCKVSYRTRLAVSEDWKGSRLYSGVARRLVRSTFGAPVVARSGGSGVGGSSMLRLRLLSLPTTDEKDEFVMIDFFGVMMFDFITLGFECCFRFAWIPLCIGSFYFDGYISAFDIMANSVESLATAFLETSAHATVPVAAKTGNPPCNWLSALLFGLMLSLLSRAAFRSWFSWLRYFDIDNLREWEDAQGIRQKRTVTNRSTAQVRGATPMTATEFGWSDAIKYFRSPVTPIDPNVPPLPDPAPSEADVGLASAVGGAGAMGAQQPADAAARARHEEEAAASLAAATNPVQFVDIVVESLQEFIRGPKSINRLHYFMFEVAVSVVAAVVLRMVTVWTIVVSFVLFAVVWRGLVTPRTVKEKRRRYIEAMEAKPTATLTEIRVWFVVYLIDILLFSIGLPLCAGLVLRSAVAPYFVTNVSWDNIAFAQLFPSLTGSIPVGGHTSWASGIGSDGGVLLTFDQLFLHWIIGLICLSVLMECEETLMPPMFAPGVDLYIMRSLRSDEIGNHSWDFVMCQVFATDFLKQVQDVIRVYSVELISLFCVARQPAWLLFQAMSWMMQSDELQQCRVKHAMRTAGVGQEENQIWKHAASHFLPQCPLNASLPALGVPTPPPLVMNGVLLPLPFWGADEWILRGFALITMATAFKCASKLPLQKLILKYMYPVATFFSFHLGLDDFLFEPEQQERLQVWLTQVTAADEEEPKPPLPAFSMEQQMSRRNYWLTVEQLPTWWQLRVLLFTTCFFAITYPVPLSIFLTFAVASMKLFSVTSVTAVFAVSMAMFAVIFCDWKEIAVSFALVLLFPVIVTFLIGMQIAELDWSDLDYHLIRYRAHAKVIVLKTI